MTINRYAPIWTQAAASALNALIVLDYDACGREPGAETDGKPRADACDEADALWLEMQRREQAEIEEGRKLDEAVDKAEAALKDGGRP